MSYFEHDQKQYAQDIIERHWPVLDMDVLRKEFATSVENGYGTEAEPDFSILASKLTTWVESLGCSREHPVEVYDYRGGRVSCGTFNSIGGTALCPWHLYDANQRYPQGWRYYPGDVCKHGKYVGGCGADLMCGYCELGED